MAMEGESCDALGESDRECMIMEEQRRQKDLSMDGLNTYFASMVAFPFVTRTCSFETRTKPTKGQELKY